MIHVHNLCMLDELGQACTRLAREEGLTLAHWIGLQAAYAAADYVEAETMAELRHGITKLGFIEPEGFDEEDWLEFKRLWDVDIAQTSELMKNFQFDHVTFGSPV